MGLHTLFPAQLRQDYLGKQLAKLDAPLIERVDVPNRTLRKDLVFVKRDE